MHKRPRQLLPLLIHRLSLKLSSLILIEQFTPEESGKLERIDFFLLFDVFYLLRVGLELFAFDVVFLLAEE
jgi:hypothetical protein